MLYTRRITLVRLFERIVCCLLARLVPCQCRIMFVSRSCSSVSTFSADPPLRSLHETIGQIYTYGNYNVDRLKLVSINEDQFLVRASIEYELRMQITVQINHRRYLKLLMRQVYNTAIGTYSSYKGLQKIRNLVYSVDLVCRFSKLYILYFNEIKRVA